MITVLGVMISALWDCTVGPGFVAISITVKLMIHSGFYGKLQRQKFWPNAAFEGRTESRTELEKFSINFKVSIRNCKCKQISCTFQAILSVN